MYRISIKAYIAAVYVASLFNSKAKTMLKVRKNWQKNLEGKIERDAKYIWFHCASAGEFEQGKPLIEKFRYEQKDARILVSFFSPSGYEMHKNYKHADIVTYLPWDTPKNAKEFCKIINPEIFILVKYDLWYYHIKEAKNLGAKVFLISGIFRDNHWLFKAGKSFFQVMMQNFSWLFVQDENSKNLLNKKNIQHCSVAGDTRYDRVIEIAETEFKDELIENFSKNSKLLIAGSTWSEDQNILAQVYKNIKQELKFVIVPHELDHKHIKEIQSLFSDSVLYSEASLENIEAAKVLIINKMGVLSRVYRYAHIAYIGGGFGKGIHNTLEAAVYGIPVFFGANFHKFLEAKALINCEAAFSISNSENLLNKIEKLLNNKEYYLKTSKSAQKHVYSQKGIISIIYDKIRDFEN
ncbi:MAG: 3-deoxy-D-manno-octulosonic acid transferase [Bacteroidales bacterium]|nr:3-deoxy-D-manno-octulosonic acid transferase [Bacteroidales bacterium]